MNTHAVPALPQAHFPGTHQRVRLCLEVARKNTAQPRSRAVAVSSTSSCGVLLAAPYSVGRRFLVAVRPQPQRRGSGMKALQLLPVNLAGRPSWRPVPLGSE